MVQPAKTSYSIYHDLVIKAPISKVFKAISEPEQLINWWPKTCTGIPKENEIYNFFFTAEYNWYGKVINYKKDSSFHIKMLTSNPDWDPTSFGFDLLEDNNTIKLQFWHTGWPACNAHFRTASFCWAMLLNGLKNYVEKGIIVPFEERN